MEVDRFRGVAEQEQGTSHTLICRAPTHVLRYSNLPPEELAREEHGRLSVVVWKQQRKEAQRTRQLEQPSATHLSSLGAMASREEGQQPPTEARPKRSLIKGIAGSIKSRHHREDSDGDANPPDLAQRSRRNPTGTQPQSKPSIYRRNTRASPQLPSTGGAGEVGLGSARLSHETRAVL